VGAVSSEEPGSQEPGLRILCRRANVVNVEFYGYAAAIGVGISVIWVAWLFAARATLRQYGLKPGYVLAIIQVAVVLMLLLAGFKISDFILMMLGTAEPANVILFRRIWIAIWAVAMVASIQVFLDIRRMAAPNVNSATRPGRRPQARGRQSERRRAR